jgi:hypothetical protein
MCARFLLLQLPLLMIFQWQAIGKGRGLGYLLGVLQVKTGSLVVENWLGGFINVAICPKYQESGEATTEPAIMRDC